MTLPGINDRPSGLLQKKYSIVDKGAPAARAKVEQSAHVAGALRCYGHPEIYWIFEITLSWLRLGAGPMDPEQISWCIPPQIK
jgi:hypothetical protein